LQTQVALSTTEAEYSAMSQSLQNVLPIVFLIQEICKKGFQVICTKPYIYCMFFEDISGALELVRLPKLCPCTKHINVCYHHFYKHMRNRLMKIFPVRTRNQIADALRLFLIMISRDTIATCVACKYVQANILSECAIFNNVASTH
jgi:hypothetical protein